MDSILTMRFRGPRSGAGGTRFSRSRLVSSDAHQLLAEIGALEKPDQRRRRAVEAFGDEFAMLDLALTHPLRHIAQEVRMACGKIADNETSDGQSFCQDRDHHRGSPFRRSRRGGVILCDQSAHRYARERVEERKYRLEHRPTD